jgi:hypothetical protein
MRLSVVPCLIVLCTLSCAVTVSANSALLQNAASLASTHTALSSPDSLKPLIERMLEQVSVEVSGEWFIAYENGEDAGVQYSNFFINRGYINVRKQFLPWLSGRITPDISVDREGDGEGDLELRLKYCYARAELPEWSVFTQPAIEFGLIERPWLGFEQKVNRYRVQGNMFLERENILNSADFGTAIEGNFGGRMDKEYRSDVGSSWDGLYGSYSIGFFNGGGYHAIERNHNKSLEGRVTVRPLPWLASGLQLTYAGTFSKGNTPDAPDWNMHVGYLTYQHRHFVLAGTWFRGEGSSNGKAVDANGIAMPLKGYSVFGDIVLGALPLNFFGRYDIYTENPDADADVTTCRIIVGTAWRLDKKSMIVVDYELDRAENEVTLLSVFKLSVLLKF